MGSTDGTTEGESVGTTDGTAEGESVGTTDGATEGESVGSTDGTAEGESVGTTDGCSVTGRDVMREVGAGVTAEGDLVGTRDGATEGESVGTTDGSPEGESVGIADGCSVTGRDVMSKVGADVTGELEKGARIRSRGVGPRVSVSMLGAGVGDDSCGTNGGFPLPERTKSDFAEWDCSV